MSNTPTQDISLFQSFMLLLKSVLQGETGTYVDLGDGGEPVPSLREALSQAGGTGNFVTTNTIQTVASLKTFQVAPRSSVAAAAATELVRKQEFDALAATIPVAASGEIPFATKADMDGDLAHDAGSFARVWNDATDANNRLYVKIGASGAGAWNIAKDRLDSEITRATAAESALGITTEDVLQTDVDVFLGTPSKVDNAGAEIEHVGDDGRVSLLLSKPARDQLARELGALPDTYLLRSTFRGTHPSLHNVRKHGKFVSGTVQDYSGRTYDVLQRQQSDLDTAFLASASRAVLILILGQSNVSGGTNTPVLTSALFPENAMCFAGMPFGSLVGTLANDCTGYADLEPISDGDVTATAQATGTMMAFARSMLLGDPAAQSLPNTRVDDVGTIFMSSWYGGQALEDMGPSPTPNAEYNYANSVSAAAQASVIAKRYDRPGAICWVAFFNHSRLDDMSPTGRTWYRAELNTILDTWMTDIEAATTQTRLPRCGIIQANNNSNPYASLAQWDVYLDRKATDTIMIGASYPFPLDKTSHIHEDYRGRMMKGEQAMHAHLVFEQTGAWVCLQPDLANVSLVGNTLTIPCLGPPGFGINHGLVNDAAGSGYLKWVPDIANMGLSTNLDGTAASGIPNGAVITDVSLSGINIVITFDKAPDAAGWSLYNGALQDNVGSDDPRRSGFEFNHRRSTIFFPTRVASPFYRMGYDVPPEIRHYLIQFEIAF